MTNNGTGKFSVRWALATLILVAGLAPAGAGTLDEVKARGQVRCGVENGLAGFAMRDTDGKWSGFEVDFCRAVAAAVLGSAEAVEFHPLTAADRFDALAGGRVDVLVRSTTWTFSRDVGMGFEFVGVLYYDGQGFLVPAALNVTSALELNRARICIVSGTTTELNLADYFRLNSMTFEAAVVETSDEALAKYLANDCDAYTADKSALASMRSRLPDPAAHLLLPEYISKEPLAPAVRQNDAAWADTVRWTLNALILAEELGVTSATAAEDRASSADPAVRRLLGVEGDLGLQLGLTPDWAFNAITTVGHYGEMFEHHLGPATPLGLERGLNAPWTEDGLLYSPPMR